MAPIKKRSSLRAKSEARRAKPVPLPLNTPIHTSHSGDSAFASSKKDKQKSKHSSFVSRIEKTAPGSKKRRRPNKKLVANLESLADALQDVEDESGEGEVVVGQAKIQTKSLKSRPGAMKRKEKLERMERDRFNANLVQMASSSGTGGIANRWAALKSHVQNNVEQKPEFARK